jgi:transposase
VADSLPLPGGLALDTATWEQTPRVVQPLVVQLTAIIQQQTGRLQVLEARMTELEARLQQRSHTSDRPPSSAPPDEKRPTRAGPRGKPGAKPGHPGHQHALLAPTAVLEVTPSACACGQTACLDTSPDETHQVIERPEIQMLGRHCVWYAAYGPPWGKVTKAQVPRGAAAGQGPRLTALLGELSGSQRGSRSAVQEFCQSVLGVHLSRGALPGAVDRVSEAIAPVYEAMAAKARRATVHSIEETSWYQHGVLAWWWVMVNTPVALFKVQASRNTAAFEALIARWAGILVSDGYGVYGQWVQARQTCLAHLIRRARGLSARKDPELAWFGRRGLAAWQRLVHWATAPPTAGDVQTGYARMVRRLNQHRTRPDEAGKCARTLAREMGALWTFVVEAGVEPTNNRAERALRFAVLWRRMRHGRYNEKGDRWVERLLSLRETCRLRGRPTCPVLVDAVTCSFHGQQPDVSWI